MQYQENFFLSWQQIIHPLPLDIYDESVVSCWTVTAKTSALKTITWYLFTSCLEGNSQLGKQKFCSDIQLCAPFRLHALNDISTNTLTYGKEF